VTAWWKWLSGGGGVAIVAALGELFRRYQEATAAADAIRQAAFDKATEAGALQAALATCQDTLVEVVRRCAGS